MTKYCNESAFGYEGFTDELTVLQSADDPATTNWGNGWYTPKREQWDELMANTNSEWTTRNGVEGRLFTSKKNGQSLFLPAAGYRDVGSLYDVGYDGYYWSSALDADGPNNAWNFYFNSDGYGLGNDIYRSYGQSVRPVRSARQN